jgi:hypothetical protein
MANWTEQALKETLDRLNWKYGKGDIIEIEFTDGGPDEYGNRVGRALIHCPNCIPFYRKFRAYVSSVRAYVSSVRFLCRDQRIQTHTEREKRQLKS